MKKLIISLESEERDAIIADLSVLLKRIVEKTKSIKLEVPSEFFKKLQMLNLKKNLKDKELLISFEEVALSFVVSDNKEEFFNTDNKKNETILKGFTLTLNVSGIEGISIDKLCCNVKLESTGFVLSFFLVYRNFKKTPIYI